MPTLGPKKKTGSLVVFLLGPPADSDGEMRALLPERVPCEGPPLDHRSQKLSHPCRLGKSTGVYVLYSGYPPRVGSVLLFAGSEMRDGVSGIELARFVIGNCNHDFEILRRCP